MGKQFLTLIGIILLTGLYASSYDVVNINFDEKTFEQLSLNVMAQVTTNELHNIQVDTLKKKQTKLMELVSAIAAEKELLIQTCQNVSGFKKETLYYITIARTGLDIINHSGQALETIEKSKLPGKVTAIVNISGLVTDAISLGKAFSDIVANCEVPNPLQQSETGKKDKYNLLNRHERLYMANDILLRLRKIDHTLCYLIYLAKTSDWKYMLFNLDRKTYTTYIMTHINTNEIINKWERLNK